MLRHKAQASPVSWTNRAGKALPTILLSLGLIVLWASPALAQQAPSLTMQLSAGQAEPGKISVLLEILFLLTILSVAPAIVLTMTSFTRIIVVFHFLRQAMGTQQMPPNQILASLAIFMTCVIMMPVGKAVYNDAIKPYTEEKIGFQQALDSAQKPVRAFLFKHTREKDLSIFYSITGEPRPENKEQVPTILLVAAYTISELKTGFTIGFLIYIPFLILDMVVASILLSMGMMMLPPVMISLPFKILLFILVDGWSLLVGSLVNTFQ
ncbi:flagellar type III secretion system pore protein FliP [Desulfovibrio aminophilus]|uniref:flagellar type III secretion system pore protein FliP n=1 Tax=Desulfovibrio aminophilus TaxID=81425 RepID=UPI00339963C7